MPNLLRLSRGHISSSCPGASRTSKRKISWPPTLESIQPVRRAVELAEICACLHPSLFHEAIKLLWYAVTTYNDVHL